MTSQQWPNWLPLRKELQEMSAYGAPQVEALARLNTNENPYSPSADLVDALALAVKQVSATLNRYPDRDAKELRRNLANYLNELSGTDLSTQNIWAANGSNEIIQSLFLAFGCRSAIGFTPSYAMHPLIARVTQTGWIDGARTPIFAIDLTAARLQIITESPSLVFVTTPNNPTGTVTSIPEIVELAKLCEQVGALLVIDEAYAEFSSEPSAITLIADIPRLVVVRTMSKAFAFAGARIGYLAADPLVVEAMALVRLPYHLSAITQAAGLVALEHRASLLENVNSLRVDRELLATELRAMGAQVLPSSANFLLFSVSDSAGIWTRLLNMGVLIRDVGLSGYLRVTIGTPEENLRFLEALRGSIEGEK